MRRLALLLEFLIIFVALPVLIYLRVLPNWPIPYLLVAGATVYFVLRRDPSFDRSQLFGWKGADAYIRAVRLRDIFAMLSLGAAVWYFAPELLFSFVRRNPLFWAIVMVFYPLVSVFPQELIYRAFLFHRYRPLFGSRWALITASALAFGFVHIIFGNWLAVGLTVIGGFLFAITYQRSRLLLLSGTEHAIFGNFLFTIGLGQFFYHGSRM